MDLLQKGHVMHCFENILMREELLSMFFFNGFVDEERPLLL